MAVGPCEDYRELLFDARKGCVAGILWRGKAKTSREILSYALTLTLVVALPAWLDDEVIVIDDGVPKNALQGYGHLRR